MVSKTISKLLKNKKINYNPKTLKWLPPTLAERQYKKSLFDLLKHLKKLFKEYLYPVLPKLLEQATYFYPERTDDWATDLEQILNLIGQKIQPDIVQTVLRMIQTGAQISNYNSSQFSKVLEKTIGINLFETQPWLKSQLENFSSQNITLIKDLSDKTIEDIKGTVLRGFQEGSRFTDISKDIQKRFAISDRRAKLIARDQTAKLNASLSRLRQEEVGVVKYMWQTSDDERVRPTHKANDGKIFFWSKPPKTGHPGTEINCRCTAIPIFDEKI